MTKAQIETMHELHGSPRGWEMPIVMPSEVEGAFDLVSVAPDGGSTRFYTLFPDGTWTPGFMEKGKLN